ncbi:hypothetical protein CCHR01_05965 [Colletotrichum chrysophilum]|uniref:C2H2-type domain-containing protein n=1 Tax=Colletotrichum chrysophilum TaxID=1836956 RepID=A0AAD9EK85_9PEZI|nr:hypothetical protein CCHR01_05965 [Colletotrichum chrysophilum]
MYPNNTCFKMTRETAPQQDELAFDPAYDGCTDWDAIIWGTPRYRPRVSRDSGIPISNDSTARKRRVANQSSKVVNPERRNLFTAKSVGNGSTYKPCQLTSLESNRLQRVLDKVFGPRSNKSKPVDANDEKKLMQHIAVMERLGARFDVECNMERSPNQAHKKSSGGLFEAHNPPTHSPTQDQPSDSCHRWTESGTQHADLSLHYQRVIEYHDQRILEGHGDNTPAKHQVVLPGEAPAIGDHDHSAGTPSPPSTTIPRHSLSEINAARIASDEEMDTASECVTSSQSILESSCSSSSFSSHESDRLSASAWKTILLDRLMEYFYSVISPSLASEATIQAQAGQRESTRKGAVAGRLMSGSSATQGGHSKENSKRRSEDHGADRSGDGDEQKRPRLTSSSTEVSRLACPYFKKTPQRYCTSKWRSCPGPGWETVHRVKEHLYRCHMLPIICPRCQITFETDEERNEHLQMDDICPKKSKPDLYGIDSKQEKLLRSRKKGGKNMSEADKWRDVYLILFPNIGPEDIPSPYLDFGGNADAGEAESAFARYERFLRRELPRKVRQELETRIEQALEPMEETLKSQIVDIVRDAQLSLFQSFVSSNPDSAEPYKGDSMAECGSMASNRAAFDGQIEALRPLPYMEGGFNGICLQLPPDPANYAFLSLEEASTFGQQPSAASLQPLGYDDLDSGYFSITPSTSLFDADSTNGLPKGNL